MQQLEANHALTIMYVVVEVCRNTGTHEALSDVRKDLGKLSLYYESPIDVSRSRKAVLPTSIDSNTGEVQVGRRL